MLEIQDSYLVALGLLHIVFVLCVVCLNTRFLMNFQRLIISIPKMASGDFLVAAASVVNALEIFENDGTVRV